MENNTKGIIAMFAIVISALIIGLSFIAAIFSEPSELHLIRFSILFIVAFFIMLALGFQGVASLLGGKTKASNGKGWNGKGDYPWPLGTYKKDFSFCARYGILDQYERPNWIENPTPAPNTSPPIQCDDDE